MKKLLFIAVSLMAAAVGPPRPCRAGQNAGAVAHIYWQPYPKGRGQESPCSFSAVTSFIVTLKGVRSFRGVDVQLALTARDFGPVPQAWQFQPGGCADGAASFQPGGWGGYYKNIFNAAPALTGTQVLNNELLYATGSCETAHGLGLFHFSSTAPSGVARDPAVEYAVWGVAVDLTAADPATGDPCAGGIADPAGPRGVEIHPQIRIPCDDNQAVVLVVDADSSVDRVPIPGPTVFGYSLTWYGDDLSCGFSPVPKKTWGWLKRVYR